MKNDLWEAFFFLLESQSFFIPSQGDFKNSLPASTIISKFVHSIGIHWSLKFKIVLKEGRFSFTNGPYLNKTRGLLLLLQI